MEPNQQIRGDELEVRQVLLYAVGSICDDEVQKQQRERHSRVRPAVSKEALALLSDLVHKQAEVLATELQHFAHHANRKSIKPEDVLLCARRHPSAVKLLLKYQREQLGTTSGGGARRRLRQSRVDSDDL